VAKAVERRSQSRVAPHKVGKACLAAGMSSVSMEAAWLEGVTERISG